VDAERKAKALALWEEGQRFQMAGALDRAIELYTASVATFPTAEAHTFRGWAYSHQGRIDDAIAECHRAIDVDPSFGNPYNDIGSYLLRLGRHDEAIGWLERAKQAPRYEPRHFPYMNLARLYAHRHMPAKAIVELEGALAHCPGEPTCTRMLSALRRALN
jgi:Tfp pilus assembly protein PilF